MLSLDDRSHLAAEQDVAAHVDLPLGALLLGKALDGFGCGLESKQLGQQPVSVRALVAITTSAIAQSPETRSIDISK